MIVGLGQVDIYSPTAEEVKSDVSQWVGNIDPTMMLIFGAAIFVLYHLFSTGKRKSVSRAPRMPRVKVTKVKSHTRRRSGPSFGEYVREITR